MSPRKSTAEPPSRGKRLLMWWEGWPRIIVLAIAGLASLAIAFGTLQGYRLLDRLGETDKIPLGGALVQPQDKSIFETQPRNVLLLGSDTREGLSPEEQIQFGSEETVEGERSDTIILIHIDPKKEKAQVIHFPRDLRVEIPGHGFNKINAAYELGEQEKDGGGPKLAIRTVREFTGLPIHNYVEVDLAGFQGLIDALGGVRICVDRPMIDPLAGLSIESAGCHTLNGDEALAFARARHIEGDPIPDFSRIGRQQQLMRAIMNRMLSAPSLLNPDRITAAAQNFTTDESVTSTDFLYLGSKLRELAQEDPSGATTLDFRVVPGIPEFIGDVSYVIAEQPEASQLFERLRTGEPLGDLGKVLINTTRSPAQVNVQARDAGDTEETAQTTAFLRNAGFIVHEEEPAPTGYEESVILYRPGSEENAEVVQGYYEQLDMEEAPPELFGDTIQVLVIVAPDFADVTAAP
jgi:LCP family protein required for cell wall assembly